MKIDFKIKKVIITIIFVATVLVFASVIGYHYYQQKELQKKIDTAILQLENKENDFNKEESRESKVSLLQSFSEEHTNYKQSKDMIEEIDKEYHLIISNMQNKLKEEYDKILVENTLKDIDKIDDKDKLNNFKAKLNDLLKIIESEKGIVCSENELKKYEIDIGNLVKTYEDRVNVIEKEEQAKKEAEQQSNIQSSQKPNSNVSSESSSSNNRNSSSNSGSNSNGISSSNNNANSSSNSGSSSNGWKKPWFELHWDVDLETGEKIPGTDCWYDPQTGNVYDLNGNQIGGRW